METQLEEINATLSSLVEEVDGTLCLIKDQLYDLNQTMLKICEALENLKVN